MVLEIKSVVWERNNEGKIIPKLVDTIEEINGKIEQIRVVPLTRGERKELMSNLTDVGNTDRDTDKELVLKHVIEPKFNEKTIEDTEFGLIENLAMTVLFASGMPVGKNKTVKKINEKIESDFQGASEK